MKKRYLLYFSVLLLLLFLGFMIGCGGDGTGGINYQNLTVVPGILTPTPAGAGFGTVSGKVIDPLNNPLSNATVKVENLTLTATTNDKGEYTLWNVPGGKQKCVASKEGYIQGSVTIQVIPGQTSQADIVLPLNSWTDPTTEQNMDHTGVNAAKYLAQISSGNSTQQALQMTVVWLKQQSNVLDAKINDSQSIWIKFNSGMEAYILSGEPVNTQGPQARNMEEQVSCLIPENFAFSNQVIASNAGKKALILSPYYWQRGSFDWKPYERLLKAAGYEVIPLYNKTPEATYVNPYIYRDKLDEYNVIIYRGHGNFDYFGGGSSIAGGLWPPQSGGSWRGDLAGLSENEIYDDWVNKRVFKCYLEGAEDPYVYINAKFIDQYYKSGDFNNTDLILLGSCLGLASNGFSSNLFPSSFVNKGTKTVVGWSESVETYFGQMTGLRFTYKMLKGNTVENAIKSLEQEDGIVDPWGGNQAKFGYYGNGNTTISVIMNPSTEPSTDPSAYHCEPAKSQNDIPLQSGNPTIPLDGTGAVWVQFKNTGSCTWYREGGNPVHLGTNNSRDRSSKFVCQYWLSNNRAGKLLEDFVNPGDIGTFEIFLWPNPSYFVVGDWIREDFRPVVENVCWMEDYGVHWLITITDKDGYSSFTDSIANPSTNPVEGIIPIGDGNVDVTVDKKGGK